MHVEQLAECMAVNSICYYWAMFFFCFIKETFFFLVFFNSFMTGENFRGEI